MQEPIVTTLLATSARHLTRKRRTTPQTPLELAARERNWRAGQIAGIEKRLGHLAMQLAPDNTTIPRIISGLAAILRKHNDMQFAAVKLPVAAPVEVSHVVETPSQPSQEHA